MLWWQTIYDQFFVWGNFTDVLASPGTGEQPGNAHIGSAVHADAAVAPGLGLDVVQQFADVILIYLAEKTGKLTGRNATDKAHAIQWLMFQMGGVGPMFGQLGYFHKFAGREIEDPRPRQRYVNEAKRLLAVLEQAMEGKDWIVGDYSIADIAIVPWLRGLDYYGVKELLGWDNHPNLVAWRERFEARPAVQTGLVTPPRD